MIASRTFRLKPGPMAERKKTHRLRLELYRTLGEMREAAEMAGHRGVYAVTDIEHEGDAVSATMYLALRRTEIDDVAHEALHVAWAIADSESGALCKADEEMVAYTLDEVMEKAWKWLLRVTPTGGPDEV
jgi:hypothetical protein